MATLTEDAKRYIVQALACFDTPTQVAEVVKEEFGIDVPRNQIAQYDPTKVSGKSLSTKWREIFEATRSRFRDEVAEIPIASRAFRLRRLEKNLDKADRMRNITLSNQTLEQAARECGDMYVNKGKNDPADQQQPTPVAVYIGVKDAKRHDDAA